MVVGVGGRIKRLLLFLPAIFYLNAFASEGYSFRGWQWPVSSLGCIQKRGREVLPRIIPHFRGQRRVSVAFPPKVESRCTISWNVAWPGGNESMDFPFRKNCVISLFTLRNRCLYTQPCVIKFIPSILILKGNFYSFENIYCVIFFFFSESLPRISKQSDILIAMNEKKYIYIKFYYVLLLHTLFRYFDVSLAFSKNKQKKKKTHSHISISTLSPLSI